MAGEWTQITLRDAGVTLIDCDHRTPPSRENGLPYVSIPQMKGGRLILSDARKISQEDFSEWTRRANPQPFDVVLSRRCNPGETAFVAPGMKFALGQNLVLLRSNGEKVFPPFLRWLVRSPQWWEQVGTFINVGAVFDSLKCADIPKFSLPLPPLPEQKAIASILGALDDKIELNRRTNATLEAMARSLFQSWFVDFDPVRAKQEGRPPSGLDTPTAALFPDQFQDSELGPIPKGWNVRQIRDVVENVYDGPHATPSEADEGPIFLGIKNLTGTNIDLGTTRHISELDWPKWTKRVTPMPLDIVFSYEATIGFFALIPPGLRCCLGRRLALVRPKPVKGHSHFWFHQFIAPKFQRYIMQHSIHGATVDRIPLIQFPNYPILDPSDEIKEAFERFATCIWNKIHNNSNQTHVLGAFCDNLLPNFLAHNPS